MGLKKNIVANYVGGAWTALMTFAFVPLYIRYLGVEAYGVVGLFAMLQGWLLLFDLGMAPAIAREMAGHGATSAQAQRLRDLLRSAETVSLAAAVVVAAGLWLSSSWLATRWLSPERLPAEVVAQALAAIGVVVGLRIVENIYRSALVGLERQVLLNAANIAIATLRGAGAVAVLAWIAPTLQAFFLWQGIVSLLAVALLGAASYRVLPRSASPGRFSVAAIRGVWRFAAGSLAIAFLSLLLSNVDKILLSHLLALRDFGYYAFAVVVANIPLGLVPPLAQAVYPRFTRLHGQGDEAGLAAAYHVAAQLVAVLVGATTVVLVLFCREILELWTQDQALAARVHALVVVLSLGSLINGLMTIPYYLQLSAGWTGLTMRVNGVAIAIVVPLLFVVVPRHGALGAAFVWLGLNLVAMVVTVPLMHRRVLRGEMTRWWAIDVGIPILAAVACGMALASGARELAERNPVALVGFAACIYLAAALAAPFTRQRMLSALRLGRWQAG